MRHYVLTGLIKYPICRVTIVGTRAVSRLKDGTKESYVMYKSKKRLLRLMMSEITINDINVIEVNN